jgi:signal transduction histidine kinase
VIFAIIVVFLVAQVGWWIIFQRRYIQKTVEYAETTWLQQAALVQQLWAATSPQGRPALAEELQKRFPQLEVRGDSVYVRPEQLSSYREGQLRFLRMFAFEGPFFLVVMLLGLWIIAHSLASEREFKRRQQNFLMAATHEFRTPISTLRLLAQTLELRELPKEKQRSYLQHMGQEISRLEHLSERLLATARLEQGLSQANLGLHDLNEVVGEALSRQSRVLEARGATLSLEPAAQPLPVELDPEAFDLVLSNLLENAVKYSPGSEKPVWVRLRAQEGKAVLEVEDRGVGIGRGEAARIFEPFYRSGDEATRETQGLGLGLYLVRSITELIGGRVGVEVLERGTRFTVRLPLASATALVTPERSPA